MFPFLRDTDTTDNLQDECWYMELLNHRFKVLPGDSYVLNTSCNVIALAKGYAEMYLWVGDWV